MKRSESWSTSSVMGVAEAGCSIDAAGNDDARRFTDRMPTLATLQAAPQILIISTIKRISALLLLLYSALSI